MKIVDKLFCTLGMLVMWPMMFDQQTTEKPTVRFILKRMREALVAIWTDKESG